MKKSSFKLNVKLPILAIQNRQHKIDPAALQHSSNRCSEAVSIFGAKRQKMLKPQKMKILGRNNKNKIGGGTQR